jgi:hypothetical protein
MQTFKNLVIFRYLMEPLIKTRFPVSHEATEEDVFRIVANWMNGNRTFARSFQPNPLLDELVSKPNLVANGRDGAVVQKETFEEGNLKYSIFSFRHSGVEASELLETKLAFRNNKTEKDSAVSVVLEYGSPRCFHMSFEPKKPLLVNLLVEGLPQFSDGWIPIQTKPHNLVDGDEYFVSELFSGTDSGNFLPVIYVSKDNYTNQANIDTEVLAQRVAGLAHVIVEPDSSFSRKLKANLRSKEMACYDGAVRIYWPKINNPRWNKIWFGESFKETRLHSSLGTDPSAGILKYICSRTRALTLDDCSYDTVSALIKKRGINQLLGTMKAESESHAELVKLYDGVIGSLERDKDGLQRQVEGLSDQLHTLKEDYAVAAANLRGAQDFSKQKATNSVVDGANSGEVLLALNSFLEMAKHGTTRLSPYFTAKLGKLLEQKKEDLAVALANQDRALEDIGIAFNDYRKMNSTQVSVLQKYGFKYTEDGSHYKIFRAGFNPDICVTLSKTSSDHRTGKNFLATLRQTFFAI